MGFRRTGIFNSFIYLFNSKRMNNGLLKNLKFDFLSGLNVFLVALYQVLWKIL